MRRVPGGRPAAALELHWEGASSMTGFPCRKASRHLPAWQVTRGRRSCYRMDASALLIDAETCAPDEKEHRVSHRRGRDSSPVAPALTHVAWMVAPRGKKG